MIILVMYGVTLLTLGIEYSGGIGAMTYGGDVFVKV